MSTAAALIIGDELLTGKTKDENSIALAQLLFEQGVDLRRIVVVPDEVDEIVGTLQKLSSKYDYVFTSGGVGPTHDDKTYEAVAKAFDRVLSFHEEALNRLMAHMKDHYPDRPITEARKRMAYLPTPCDIIWTPGLWVPLVVVNNVYVLPGIPSLFQTMLQSARAQLRGNPKERICIFTQMAEGDIAESLSQTQQKYPDVAIGSYPKTGDSPYQVMVTLEGRDRIRVHRAAEEVERAIHGFR